MLMASYCFAVILVFCFLALAYFTIRNNWVFRVRMDLIEANFDVYKTLPEYGFMMRKWWIWDASRFIGMKDEKPTKKQRAATRGAAIIAKARNNAK